MPKRAAVGGIFAFVNEVLAMPSEYESIYHDRADHLCHSRRLFLVALEPANKSGARQLKNVMQYYLNGLLLFIAQYQNRSAAAGKVPSCEIDGGTMSINFTEAQSKPDAPFSCSWVLIVFEWACLARLICRFALVSVLS